MMIAANLGKGRHRTTCGVEPVKDDRLAGKAVEPTAS
jgi:hypothetical protein